MKKKPKKKKPPTKQQLIEKLRKKCVTRAKVLAKRRDGYKCLYCGVGKPQRMIHSHHFYHEGLNKHMSADVKNLVSLCATHHQGGKWMRSNSGFNFHNSPTEAKEWFDKTYPDVSERLKIRSQEKYTLDMSYWLEKEKELLELEEMLDRGIEDEIENSLMASFTPAENGDEVIENEVNKILDETLTT